MLSLAEERSWSWECLWPLNKLEGVSFIPPGYETSTSCFLYRLCSHDGFPEPDILMTSV